ncbi:DEAD/DEAH box helicase family protein, partial [bacterium]|nr:DEAD/DEAH box helicase family protein [bacterium]
MKGLLTVVPKSFDKSEPEPMLTYIEEDDCLQVPYRWGIDNFGRDGAESQVTMGKPIEINMIPTFALRDDQVKLFNDLENKMIRDHRTLLSAKAATGKTALAIYLMSIFKMTTAIIVGKSVLIDQWRDRILQFTDVKEDEIGLVKAEDFIYENKKIVLISTDSFYNREFDEDFLTNFGLVITDEHHNFNSQEKFRALERFNAKYQLGMSATHDRSDGRDKVSQLCFGDIDVIGTETEPVPIKVVLVPIKHTEPLNINYQYFKKQGLDPRWTEISKLSMVEHRNSTASHLIQREYDAGYYSLCVSNRIEQLQHYHERLIEMGVKPEDIGFAARSFYTGLFNVSLIISVNNIKDYKDEIKTFSDDVKYSIGINKISARNFKNRGEVSEFIKHCE